jgi:hypothetical protein
VHDAQSRAPDEGETTMRSALLALVAVAGVLATSTFSAQAQGRCPQFDGYPAWAYKAFCVPTSG